MTFTKPQTQKPNQITRFFNALLLRDMRIRQMIERELARDKPSPLRLMRMKRIVLSLRQRLEDLVLEANSTLPRNQRLVPVLARMH